VFQLRVIFRKSAVALGGFPKNGLCQALRPRSRALQAWGHAVSYSIKLLHLNVIPHRHITSHHREISHCRERVHHHEVHYYQRQYSSDKGFDDKTPATKKTIMLARKVI